MRIIIVSRIYRPEPAAASILLGSVADQLTANGHEVTVLTTRPPRGMSTVPRGERVRTFPVLRDRSGYVRGYVQYMSFDLPLLFRLLFSKRADAVLVEPPPTTGAVVRLICAFRRIPYVYDAADIWSDAASHATNSQLVVRVLRGLERFAMRGADSLVTISQGVVDRLCELGIDTPTQLVGFGADTETFAYTEAPIEKTFLYAGTHTGLHGADILIDAFAHFSRGRSGYRLRFIGNGTGHTQMRERARELGVESLITFEEAKPADQLQFDFAQALASIATLLPGGGYEYAFATKIYSSLASGCPVIFAGPGPTAAFLQEASQSVKVGSTVDYQVESISTAMRTLADHPLAAEDRKSLASWAAETHSMRSVAERIAETLADVGRMGRRRR